MTSPCNLAHPLDSDPPQFKQRYADDVQARPEAFLGLARWHPSRQPRCDLVATYIWALWDEYVLKNIEIQLDIPINQYHYY
jgi:hypothetical protein